MSSNFRSFKDTAGTYLFLFLISYVFFFHCLLYSQKFWKRASLFFSTSSDIQYNSSLKKCFFCLRPQFAMSPDLYKKV